MSVLFSAYKKAGAKAPAQKFLINYLDYKFIVHLENCIKDSDIYQDLKTDIENKKMSVNMLEGLMEDDD